MYVELKRLVENRKEYKKVIRCKPTEWLNVKKTI